MIDDEFIIRVRKFFLLSFSHPVCSPFFLSEGVALNYNGLGNWVERDHARGEMVFSLSRTRLRSLSFRVIIGRKLHGYLAAARGRYDRYDRASGRETCSRVYRPLRSPIQARASKPVIIASLDAGPHSFAFSIPCRGSF